MGNRRDVTINVDAQTTNTDSIEDTEKKIKALKDEAARLTEESEQLATALHDVGDAAKEAGQDAEKAGDSAEDAADGFKKAEREARDLQESLEGFKAQSDFLGDLFTGAILGGAILEGGQRLYEFANASVAVAREANAGSIEVIALEQALARLDERVFGVQDTVGSGLIPVLTDVINVGTIWYDNVGRGAQAVGLAVGVAVESFTAGLDIIGNNVNNFISELNSLLGNVGSDFRFDPIDTSEWFTFEGTPVQTMLDNFDRNFLDPLAELDRQAQSSAAYASAPPTIYEQQAMARVEASKQALVLMEQEEEALQRYGGTFVAVMDENEEALQRLMSAQADHFDQVLKGAEVEENLVKVLYDSAAAAGAGAEELYLLAAATGEYSEEALDAALKTAAVMAQIEELGRAIAAGDIGVDEALTRVQEFQNVINNGDTTVNIFAEGQDVGNIVESVQATGG